MAWQCDGTILGTSDASVAHTTRVVGKELNPISRCLMNDIIYLKTADMYYNLSKALHFRIQIPAFRGLNKQNDFHDSRLLHSTVKMSGY